MTFETNCPKTEATLQERNGKLQTFAQNFVVILCTAALFWFHMEMLAVIKHWHLKEILSDMNVVSCLFLMRHCFACCLKETSACVSILNKSLSIDETIQAYVC